MGRGGNLAKRDSRRSVRNGIRSFFDREFDWIAWVVIAVMILLTLVFF